MKRWILLTGIVGFVAAVAITRTPDQKSSEKQAGSSMKASTSSHVRNPANDWLLAQTAPAAAEKLGKVAGQGCKGQVAFYQGDMKSNSGTSTDHRPKLPTLPGTENDAFWNVKCADGRSYSIEVRPDGSGSVLECSVLEAVHGGTCFKKF